MSFVRGILGENSATDDRFIALNMDGAFKAGATAYVAGTLEAATPEVRKLYFGFCSELVQNHEKLINYLNDKGWFKVYGEPKVQLEEAIEQTSEVVHHHTH